MLGPPPTLAAMTKLNVALTNCHGIRELNATFDFKCGNAVAVHAPKGTMKTSLAHTFKDFAKGGETIDHMFRDRESQRSTTDEAGGPSAPQWLPARNPARSVGQVCSRDTPTIRQRPS